MAPRLLTAGAAVLLCSSIVCNAAAVANPDADAEANQYFTLPTGGLYTSTQYYTPPSQSTSAAKTSSSPSNAATSTASSATSASSSTCPKIWSIVAADLKQSFTGCNDLARSAIRFAFHDAAGYSYNNPISAPASGGADGSLLLNDGECSRSTEAPLKQKFRDPFLLGKYYQYKVSGVGAADLVQFAGAMGIKACPGGPTVKTVVGRKDSDVNYASPEGNLPAAYGKGSDYESLIQLWSQKGFSPRELAALMGAHTVSQSFAQQSNGVPNGSPQDKTPTVWDNEYYHNTQSDKIVPGVYSFASDVTLSNATTECGNAYTAFKNDQATWNTEFAAAMYKLSILGIPQSDVAGFADCTSLLS